MLELVKFSEKLYRRPNIDILGDYRVDHHDLTLMLDMLLFRVRLTSQNIVAEIKVIIEHFTCWLIRCLNKQAALFNF